jgi:hypothetical protein
MSKTYLIPVLLLALSAFGCDDDGDDTTAGEMTAGEMTAGEMTAGESVAGESVAGESVAGESVAGESVAGESVAGESVAGEMGGEMMMTGEPGCYSGPPNHMCDCTVTEAECMGIWTDRCACDGEVNTNYSFESRFEEGSSISYSGQTARHALMSALKSYMGGLEDSIAANGVFEEGSLVSILTIFFDCADDICGGEDVTVSGPVDLAQTTISEISSGKNLVGKIAGNDLVGQHKDWTTGFVGWGDDVISPEGLVRAWFDEVEAHAINISNQEYSLTPGGENILRPEVSALGQDYTQLVQKFLLGAIAFSQGADDYLDDTDEGKGLLAGNDAAAEGKSYTGLEHSWDEGFGYFGAARDYLDYTDDEIAGKGGRDEYQGAYDSNGDGTIDLVSEFNWGHAVNAAKRDRGHSTDLTTEAYTAFLAGRTLISSAEGNLTPEQFTELQGIRDIAVLSWEKAIAATVIHYINDTIGDMDSGDEYDFYTHAKHWSEMKGFALSFQFNPRSPVSGEAFVRIHTLFGVAPALPGDANFDDYRTGLLEARSILGAAYEFDDADVETW